MTPEYDPCIYHSVQVFGLFRNTFSNLACEAPDAFPEMRLALRRLLATTTLENVAPRGKDPVGANLYIHFPCLYCWRHRQLQRYNIRERETKEQRLSQWKILYPWAKNYLNGVQSTRASFYLGFFFRDFRGYKSYHFLKFIRSIQKIGFEQFFLIASNCSTVCEV